MRRLILAGLVALMATPVLPQQAAERPSIWSFFTAENIATGFVTQALFYARLLADIRYDAISVDPMAATVTISGLDVRPDLLFAAADDCVITVARATLRGATLGQLTTGRGNIALDRVRVDFDCFPPEARPALGMTGIEDLMIQTVSVDVTYDYPSGAMQVTLEAGADGLLTILGDVDLAYAGMRMDFSREEPVPSAQVRQLRVQIEDRGLAARLEQVLPPQMRDPDVLATQAREIATQAMREMSLGELNAAQNQLIADAEAMGRAVGNGARRVVLETTIDGAPVRLNERSVTSPDALIALLKPRLSSAPRALVQSLPVALLAKAKDGTIADADRLQVGRALLNGVAAPRNVELGLAVLDPLVATGDGEAAFLIAEVALAGNPNRAYQYALLSAARGYAPAVAVADRAEDQLTLEQVLAAQRARLPQDTYTVTKYAGIGEMRAAAQDHLLGLGTPRSFVAAAYWASFAAAAGDRSAAALRDQIDQRMRLRGLAEQWSPVVKDIEEAVLNGWLAANMPQSLNSK